MFTPALPVLFILLWSSAFISAKYGLPDAGPFSFLLTRFIIVFLLFGVIAIAMRRPWPRGPMLVNLLFVGVLMHGFYLGGVFFAIAEGMPAGLSALIVSTQPVLTAALGVRLLGERPAPAQWLGIALGAAGVVLVLWPRLGGDVPLTGFAACIVSLLAITLGTIWQKRHGGAMDLLSGNAMQALAAAIFYGVIVLAFDPDQERHGGGDHQPVLPCAAGFRSHGLDRLWRGAGPDGPRGTRDYDGRRLAG
jgi:drug/metabolite transporter (DMT)-like permease